jgi:tetratricopeptide (TPR) repeat protein
MAIEGSLADVSLADICQLLSLGRKTGCLTVTDRSNFGYVYFKKGRVVYASVLNRPDRLGEILVKNGVIHPEDLSKAIQHQEQEGQKKLGEILLGFGMISSEDLQKWVTVQVEEAVYHLFSWNQGTFQFNPGELPDESQVLLVTLNADGLLLEGARRVDEWSQIEKEVYSLDLVFKVGRDPLESGEVELSGNQKRLLPLLNGRRTVRELVEESGLVEFETGKALFELAQAGFVQAVGEKVQGPADEGEEAIQEHVRLGQAFYRAGMLEDAAEEFHGALALKATEPTSRFFMGLIELKSGELGKALSHFDAIPEPWAGKPAVLRNRAFVLEGLERFDEALEALKKAEALDADDRGLLLARGICELKGGEPAGAWSTFIEYRNKVGRKEAPPPIYYAFAVLASAAAGYLNEAVSVGREGLKTYPAEPSILVNTGAILDHKGNHEAAEQYFIRALACGSEVPAQAHKNLGDQAFRRGDMKVAQSHFEQAVRLNPSLGDDVFLKLGQIASDAGDRELAVLLLGRAVELNPDNEDARTGLASLSALP